MGSAARAGCCARAARPGRCEPRVHGPSSGGGSDSSCRAQRQLMAVRRSHELAMATWRGRPTFGRQATWQGRPTFVSSRSRCILVSLSAATGSWYFSSAGSSTAWGGGRRASMGAAAWGARGWRARAGGSAKCGGVRATRGAPAAAAPPQGAPQGHNPLPAAPHGRRRMGRTCALAASAAALRQGSPGCAAAYSSITWQVDQGPCNEGSICTGPPLGASPAAWHAGLRVRRRATGEPPPAPG